MSDFSQTIVDIEVAAHASVKLGDEIRDWLVGSGIVEARTTNSTLSSGGGHNAGANYKIAIDTNRDCVLDLRTNGVAILIGRRVFDTSAHATELCCDACKHSFSPNGAWGDAVASWFGGDDRATF